jgi:hypothetical protein
LRIERRGCPIDVGRPGAAPEAKGSVRV